MTVRQRLFAKKSSAFASYQYMTTTQSHEDLKPRIMEELDRHPYRAPVWLRWNHGQTAWAPYLRRKNLLPYRLERIETPDQIIPAIKRGIAQTQEGKPALLEFLTSQELEISMNGRRGF